MDNKHLHRSFAILAFLIATISYLMTVQPTVPFWDCGEFSAAAIHQQVPHPPGAPLFLMVGKMFEMLIPFGDPGWKVNLVSVFASSFSVLLLYLIGVMVLNSLRGAKPENFYEALSVYGSAFVGAMAFTYSDTFWFNAVESEVYAASTLFVAIIVYLMMRWNEEADNPGHERYLLLIAYLIGLSTGVHLLSVLTVFSIVMIVYFRKYDFNLVSFIWMGIAAVVIFFGIYPGIVKWFPALLDGHSPWKTEAREWAISDSFWLVAVVVLIVAAAIYGLLLAYRKNISSSEEGLLAPLRSLGELCMKMRWILLGVFGVAMMAFGDGATFVVVGALMLIYMLGAFGYLLAKERRAVLGLVCASFLLMLVGYGTYTQILLRANAKPPMNENNPDNLSKLVSYLGREQYGEAPSWPRRYRTDRHIARLHPRYGEWSDFEYKVVERKDGTRLRMPDYENSNINTLGELNYLWDYQVRHMYWRYFYWNFVGRTSDVQDAPAAWFSLGGILESIGFDTTREDTERFNYDSGYKDLFPIQFFALPFFLGLIGFFFHITRDPRMASVYLVMFLLMGVLAAIQQNQQNPQPRERDYFYVGSFMVYCMWIGMGVYFLIEMLAKNRPVLAIRSGVLALSLGVPGLMAVQGWEVHDRSGHYLAFDYAYNILQSVEQDAIVFTNGDNDTFPVWFLQDVEGVRRDVRIANLSLGNTLWYIDQLKNETPWGAKKIPLSFSDKSIKVEDENDPDALTYYFDYAQEVEIPVREEILRQYTDDEATIAQGKMRFSFIGDPYNEREGRQTYVFRVQDQLVKDILAQTRFERPVYYSMSVGPDAFCGLEDHFRMEGMALRICPVPQGSNRGLYNVSEEIMDKTVLNVIPGDTYYTEQHYGLKFRNLNNPDVFFDESNRRPIPNYRQIYLNYAQYLMREGKNTKAAAVLDTMNKYVSPTLFPMSFALEAQLAEMYKRCGVQAQAEEFANMALESSLELINNSNLDGVDPYLRSYDPRRVAADSYILLGRYDDAIELLQKYRDSASQVDPSIQAYIDQLKIEKFEAAGDYAGAIGEARRIQNTYMNSGDRLLRSMVGGLDRKIRELQKEAGIIPDDSLAEAGAESQSR